ncbi:MAG TPA: TIGR03435 family protein [Bryobacteraceae bacterium]|nr:TIGR03435 family protein [Bryobacteraceae bacterium]
MCNRLFALLLTGAAFGCAQTAAAPSFEVATIKFHPEPVNFSADPRVQGRRVTGTASTLLDLITVAYGVKYDQISGAPKWAESDHYDLSAKAEGEGTLSKSDFQKMMQSLLADRFGLQTHREAKDRSVWALVVGKNGPKLKESATDASPGGHVRAGAGGLHMEVTKGTMEQLAAQLSHSAGKPVVDRTNLTGSYAYTLDWVPATAVADPDSNTPSLLAALQEQLGLKLEAAKAPYPMLVIDRAQKPSEN